MSDVVVVGSFVQDLSFRTSRFPRPGETGIGSFQTGPGGKGFNQAVCVNRQGVETVFVGAVGDDAFGRGVKQFISDEHLQAELQTFPEHPSGVASIIVDDQAANLIVVSLGANEHLGLDFIEAARGIISGASILVCQAESNLDATKLSLEIARSSGAKTILNPAPLNPGIDPELVELADVLVPNESEFVFLMRSVYQAEVPDEFWLLDDEKIASFAARLPCPIVIITLGENGCFVADKRSGGYRVPAEKVDCVDTTGAGDAFIGGLAAGLMYHQGDFRQAVQFATVVAGMSTEKQGAASAMPHQKDVEERISRS